MEGTSKLSPANRNDSFSDISHSSHVYDDIMSTHDAWTECHISDADLQISDDFFLAPVTVDEFDDVMMFLNHSCEPNVGVQGQIVFVAMRDIAAGEELALDYATVDNDSGQMTCACGAERCRKIITGQDWRKPELQQKYGNYFAWHLLQKIR